MAFWLARHAQPLVAPGICYGRTDMGAEPLATQHAAALLVAALPPDMPEVLHIVTSPLQRCTQLARAVQALRPESTLAVDQRLAEMDFGDWEGQAWADIDPQALQAWTNDFADYPVGGRGESVRAFMRRIAQALPEHTAHHVLWVTHAGVERAVSLLTQGVACPTRADQWPRDGLGFGEWRVV